MAINLTFFRAHEKKDFPTPKPPRFKDTEISRTPREHSRTAPALSKAGDGQLALGNSAPQASTKEQGTAAEEREGQLSWDPL